MHPILFNLLGHDIRAYSVFMALALIVVVIGIYLFAKKAGLASRPVFFILLIMAASAFVGARLLHAILNFGAYLSYPQRIIAFNLSGLSLYGGEILAIITGLIANYFLKFNLWKLGDIAAPFLGIGIAIARVGCFLNGCCFGKETNLPWAVEFPFMSPAHRYQLLSDPSEIFTVIPVHPTQIYELIAALIGSIIACICIKKKLPEGTAILAFGAWFTTFRWFNYCLRAQALTFDAPAYFYPALYGLIIALCLTLIYYKFYKRGKIR